jgi:hypothetical protein
MQCVNLRTVLKVNALRFVGGQRRMFISFLADLILYQCLNLRIFLKIKTQKVVGGQGSRFISFLVNLNFKSVRKPTHCSKN